MKPNVPLYAKIRNLCREIEKEEDITILFAVENGSRAWRMESANSDYDVRFVYHHPLEKYISLKKPKDVIDKFYSKDCMKCTQEEALIDAVGFDIFKYLDLLVKSNPTAIEWLTTDIVYYGEQNKVFRKFALDNLNKIALVYHYKSLCKQNYIKHLKSGAHLSYKKYLYSLRGLVNAKFVAQFSSMPLISFTEAVKQISMPEYIKNKCLEIIELKRKGKEKEIITNIKHFDDYIDNFLKEEVLIKEKPSKGDIGIIDKEIRKLLIDNKAR